MLVVTVRAAAGVTVAALLLHILDSAPRMYVVRDGTWDDKGARTIFPSLLIYRATGQDVTQEMERS